MPRKPNTNQALTDRPPRKKVDWLAVESAYCSSRMTDKELGALFGISDATICNRRGQDRIRDPGSWRRVSSDQVARATDALLAEDAVVRRGGEASTVLATAVLARDVILKHRTDIERARAVTAGLVAELESVSLQPEAIAEAVRKATEGMDPLERGTIMEQLRNLLRLHSRATSAHKLADALAKLQHMERTAFGIKDSASDDAKRKSLSDVERAARVAAILDRARKAQARAPRDPAAPPGALPDPPAPGQPGAPGQLGPLH